ncbi:3'-5' exonuclease [Paenibacillus larvae]|nr:3'-5' exonuclease [Paenibacillus larvae]MDT2235455.1 3'-5' exonuclease [Paenibacillus larvae]
MSSSLPDRCFRESTSAQHLLKKEGCKDNRFEGEHGAAAALEEERRLAYVAVTRAKEELYISSPGYYRGKQAHVSRFILQPFESRRSRVSNTAQPVPASAAKNRPPYRIVLCLKWGMHQTKRRYGHRFIPQVTVQIPASRKGRPVTISQN